MHGTPEFTEAAIAAATLVFIVVAMYVPGVLRRNSGILLLLWGLLVLVGHLSAIWIPPLDYSWLNSWPNRIFAGALWTAAGSCFLLFPLVAVLLLRMISPTANRGVRTCLQVGIIASSYFVVQAVVEMGWCATYAITAVSQPGWIGIGKPTLVPQQFGDLYLWFWNSESSYGAACLAVLLCGVLAFLRASAPPSLPKENGAARDKANRPKFGTTQGFSESSYPPTP
ncbi:MAG: hypothetical protein IPK83_10655 [Planctomycetes bacterium]|nr:hypothetical protein [Planctomycetota bacterium]